MRNELIADARQLLEAFGKSGDAAPVLSSRAAGLRNALFGISFQEDGQPRFDLRTSLAAAQLAMARYLALPEGQDREELGPALEACAVLLIVDPDLVPAPLRQATMGYLTQSVNEHPLVWGTRAALISDAYRNREDPATAGVLDRVASVLRTAVPLTKNGKPSPIAGFLGVTLEALYIMTGAVELLTEAIEVLAGEISRHGGDADDLTILGALHRRRFDHAGSPEDLELAVARQREAVAAAADISKQNQCRLNLAVALQARYQQLGHPTDIGEAIAILRGVIAATPGGDGRRAGRLDTLGSALDSSYEAHGNLGDLDEAIGCHRAALELAPSYPAYLVNLSIALRNRYYARDRDADLDEAVETMRRALEATPAGHAKLADRRINMTSMLQTRYERDQDPTDLAEARELLHVIGDGPPDLQLINLRATDLEYRWDADRDESHLTEGMELLVRGLASGSGSQEQIARSHSALASLWNRRYQATQALEDLDRAIEHARLAVRLNPSRHGWQAVTGANLGRWLQVRFERAGSPQDIEEAIEITKTSVAMTVSPEARSRRLSDLGNALRLRFERTGNIDDLTESISVNRRAVSYTGDVDPRITSNLTVSLRARYMHLGEIADLDEAIESLRPLFDLPWNNDEHRIRALSNIAIFLHERFSDTGNRADLDEAIDFARGSVQEVGELPDKARCLTTLASALKSRFDLTGDVADLDEMLALFRGALAATREEDALWPRCAANVASAVLDHVEQVYDGPALDEAQRLLDAALGRLDPADASRRISLVNRARVWEFRYAASGDPSNQRRAIADLAEAAGVTGAPARLRISAARSAAVLAAETGDWLAATDHYAAAIALLPVAAWRGLLRTSQEGLLESWLGLVGSGAAAAIQAGMPHRAVELLEQGRAVLWSQLLELRSDLNALAAVAPEPAERLRAIGSGLERQDSASSLVEDDARLLADQRIELASEWDRTVAEVRALPGCSDFLRPASFNQLRAVVPDGTVVVVNFSVQRCDALAVDRNGVRVIPLPLATVDDVLQNVNAYLALTAAGSSAVSSVVDWVDTNQRMQSILEWLWNAVVEPVVTELGIAEPSARTNLPRLWWCPNGLFALLPLHAAGRHDPDGAAPASLMDVAISSYTPTIHALANGNDRGDSPGPGRLLLVAMPDTPGMAQLPGAQAEAEFVGRRFQGTHTLLTGAEATRARVLDELAGHTWVHCACHGRQDMESPAHAGIALQDGLLTINDFSARRLRMELAFLSACETATGSMRLPDESIHLTSSLQLAGCRHVIGTLWAIADASAADLADAVYAKLAAEETLEVERTATVLSEAVRSLRDRVPLQPLLWAPYIHAGP